MCFSSVMISANFASNLEKLNSSEKKLVQETFGAKLVFFSNFYTKLNYYFLSRSWSFLESLVANVCYHSKFKFVTSSSVNYLIILYMSKVK